MLTQEEMLYFKEKLIARQLKIEHNLSNTSHELDEMRDLELNDEGDYASSSTDTAIDNAIMDQQVKELSEIVTALSKISHGTYGICEMCGEPIGLPRLEVKNFALYCISCRPIVEKNKIKG